MDRSAFSFAFQPIVHAPSGRVWSHEALLRGPAGEPAGQVLSGLDEPALHRLDATGRYRFRGFGNDRSRLSSHGSRGERSRLLALPSVGIQRIQGDGIQQLIRRATIPAIRVQCRTEGSQCAGR